MTGRQKLDVIAKLTVLAEAFGRRLSDGALEIYIRALDDLDYDEVVKALNILARERDTFPQPAAIRRMCLPPDQQPEEIAQRQAALVLQAVRRTGARYEPAWDDPITAELFRSRFRWGSLCGYLTESEERWFVREFIEAYVAVYRRPKQPIMIEQNQQKVLDLLGKISQERR